MTPFVNSDPFAGSHEENDVSNLTENDDHFMDAMERIVNDDEWGRAPTVTLQRDTLKRLVDIARGRRQAT